ncbi:MAG: hypothetical protein ACYSUM_12205 [Planctomycetota bacterium]|jgi:hypothetical protein
MRLPGSALLILILLAGCGTTYALDKTSVTVPALRMTEAIVAKGGTRLKFEYVPEQTRRVGVHPPGHEGAFSIQSLDRKQTYKLTAVDGIAVLPDRTTVDSGSTLEFSLTFEPIPDDMWEFHVGEGEYGAEAGESSWQFLKVSLR